MGAAARQLQRDLLLARPLAPLAPLACLARPRATGEANDALPLRHPKSTPLALGATAPARWRRFEVIDGAAS